MVSKSLGRNIPNQKDQNLKARYENTFLGVRRATSVGGSVTGQGGDIILVDDPTSPKMLHQKQKEIMLTNGISQHYIQG